MIVSAAYEFLREWRKAIPVEAPEAPPLPYDWNAERTSARSQLHSLLRPAAADSMIAAFDGQLEMLRKHVPAPERIPPLYWLLARNSILAHSAIVAGGHSFGQLPIVDTLPTAAINATTIKPRGLDQFFVLFPSGVKYFTSLFFDFVLHAAELVPPRAAKFEGVPDMWVIHEALRDRVDLLRRFAELIMTYVAVGSPFRIDPWGPQPADKWSAGRIKTGADLFLLAHELAHVSAGHFLPHEPPASGVKIRTHEGTVEIPPWVRTNWDDEFEADKWAIHAIFHLSPRIDGGSAELFGGAYLLLCGLRAIGQAVCILQYGSTEEMPSGTHPQLETRLEIAREICYSLGKGEIARRSQVLEYIVKYCSEKLLPSLIDGHVTGRRPAASWRATETCRDLSGGG